MAKHKVRQTKGIFKLVGKAKGVKSQRFFKTQEFDSGTKKNSVSFGLLTSPTNESYVQLEGFTQKTAKFNKWNKEEKKNYMKDCSWAARFDFDEEGFSPMFGTRINLTEDKEATATLFQYDACQELKDSLTDDLSVFIEGNLNFSSYTKDGEVKRYKSLEPTKIYRQSSEIDFNAEDFKEENRFQQEIIFMGIEQEKDPETDKATGRAIVSAKIVTYDSVEDTEFIVENAQLISNMRSKIKPYYAFKTVGRFVTKVEEEIVEADESGWGDEEDLSGSTSIVRFKEWIITKVYPETIDKETYTEEVLASITQAEEDYGDFGSDEDADDGEVW